MDWIEMPYQLKKSGKGFVVVNVRTGQRMSNHPLSLERAKAQMIALNLAHVRKDLVRV